MRKACVWSHPFETKSFQFLHLPLNLICTLLYAVSSVNDHKTSVQPCDNIEDLHPSSSIHLTSRAMQEIYLKKNRGCQSQGRGSNFVWVHKGFFNSFQSLNLTTKGSL